MSGLFFQNNMPVAICSVWARLHEKCCQDWKNAIDKMPKLRTYKTIKTAVEPKSYVMSFMNRGNRSILAQLRFGILPLGIETGRWHSIVLENRLCYICNSELNQNNISFLNVVHTLS